MRDITAKQTTLRTASAQAVVYCTDETLTRLKEKTIPKGDAFEFARAAGYFGAKNTSHLIPHCHPIGIDSLEFEFDILTEENTTRYIPDAPAYRPGVVITGTAKCIGRTGIEIEAITGVTVAALTMYDILKPIDTHLELSHIRVLKKTGGKSDHRHSFEGVTCAVLVCSDSAFEGKKTDTSGEVMRRKLLDVGADVVDYTIVPDAKPHIQRQIRMWVEEDIQFIFTTGGTGLGPRDVTVESVSELLEKEALGIVEAMRSYGQMRTPLAMMSRAVAGSVGATTIITLPGSPRGVAECLDAILPFVFHTRAMLEGGGH
ncbi:MAG TPA: bifunctional molybdenum cofactor biosynthesis protein MoaC/MoaB [Bacteroidota bacterium]|nr:bifunctional molybdenum cofactor biosynthesis protein MoaC/MoaB [Bacteroidota bacterium]